MRALVTGSTGFIGRKLVEALLGHGLEVTALVRTFEQMRTMPRAVRTVAGDITKPDTLPAALRDVDLVFHLAAINLIGAKPKDYARIERINVAGTRHVLELAAQAGAHKIIHVSTVAVHGDTHGQMVDEGHRANGVESETWAQATKRRAHYEVVAPLQQRGLPIVIVAPGTVYGVGDTSSFRHTLRSFARRRLFVALGGQDARCWTYVDDVVAGLWLAAEKGRIGETYHLAGNPLTYQEFFAIGQTQTHYPAPRVWVPPTLAFQSARLLRRALPAWAETLRAYSGVTYLAQSDKAKHELGWSARSVDAGWRAMAGWVKELGEN